MKVASFIPIKLNNQRLPGKNTMLLNNRPTCDYIFEAISNVDGIDEKYEGNCKFIITYNNDPYICSLAEKYGFDTFVKERLHNMLQSTKPGEMFEELLIGNYDLKKQAEENNHCIMKEAQQLSLFDYQYDY